MERCMAIPTVKLLMRGSKQQGLAPNLAHFWPQTGLDLVVAQLFILKPLKPLLLTTALPVHTASLVKKPRPWRLLGLLLLLLASMIRTTSKLTQI